MLRIHREGHTILLITFIVLAAINIGIANAFPGNGLLFFLVLAASTIAFTLVLQFFRNPERKASLNDKLVIAPADGKVVVIEETTENEYLRIPCIQVSIFMSPLNVHVNRNPVSGKVSYIKYHPGKYLVAWHPKSSTDNERTTIVYKLKNGVEIVLRQIAGAVARRIRWYIKPEDDVVQGQEFGFIRFGSRVDLFLPVDARILVNIDDITKGGETVIAELT